MPATITRDNAHSRQLTLRAETADDATRSVEAVIATENMVAVWDRSSGRIIDEVLLVNGVRLPKQLPLLSDHSRDLGAVLGSVRNLRVEAGRLVGRAYFAKTHDVDEVWEKVRDGHVTDISVGYQVDQAVEIPSGRTQTVNGRSFTAGPRTLRVATAWTAKEASCVAIGADPAATIRSAPTRMENSPMIRVLSEPADKLYRAIAPVVQRGGQSLTWAQAAAESLRFLGQDLPPNDRDLVRTAVSQPAIAETFNALFGSSIQRGYESEPDTTAGWTREVPAVNFLPSQLFTLDEQARLEKASRGVEAEHASYGLKSTTWRIARYSRQFVVDEQDMVNGEPLGAVLLAVEQLGAAAARVRPDLVYSLLLANPTMTSDQKAVFHVDHANLGSGAGSAMGTSGLGAGIAAIGNQTYSDEEGIPIHVNNRPAILIVPPDLAEVSRRTVRNIALQDGNDIEVRAESRLGAAGLLDPDTDELQAGTATNWLLSARAAAVPSVVVGGLNGNLTPSVRKFTLSQGQWGVGWDIVLDIGAALMDYRGLYWSMGV